MRQLREFAEQKKEFDRLNIRILALSVEEQEHARTVWEKVVKKQFLILSDPERKVIRSYGLVHAAGRDGEDIAIRTTILVDEAGVERWRLVSKTKQETPRAADVLERLREAPPAAP